MLDGRFGSATSLEVFGYRNEWGLPGGADRREIEGAREGGAGS